MDGSPVSCFVVAECEGALRPRRLLLCGHRPGAAQMWDLTAPIDKAAKPSQTVGGSGMLFKTINYGILLRRVIRLK